MISRMPTLTRLIALPLLALPLLAQGRPPEIETDQVRVVRALARPHNKTAPHEHKVNRVMVYLQGTRQEIVTKDGKKTLIDAKPGDVKWSAMNGIHTSEILSDTPVTIVEVELKKPGDPSKTATSALDPLKVDPGKYKLEFENDQVRVSRVKIGAHEKVPLHEHLLNRVVVYISDQNGTMTTTDGATTKAQHKAGEVSWGTPTKHREENLLDHPFEAVVVELKY